MKTTLYMAITANGYIAHSDGSTDFVSPTEWKAFSKATAAAGCLIVGRKTYEVMCAGDEFKKLSSDLAVAVVTSNADYRTAKAKHTTATSPLAAVTELSRRGYSQSIIGGGSSLNASFMGADLVDELTLDVMPTVLDAGIPLLTGAFGNRELELLESNNLSGNGIQLRYRVVRKS